MVCICFVQFVLYQTRGKPKQIDKNNFEFPKGLRFRLVLLYLLKYGAEIAIGGFYQYKYIPKLDDQSNQ